MHPARLFPLIFTTVLSCAASPQEAEPPGETGPKLAREASLELIVESPSRARGDISELMRTQGGDVSSVEFSAFRGAATVKMGVRVPTEKLEFVLEALRNLGEVSEEQLMVEDVTDPWRESTSRLANLKSAESRLREIMQRAGTVGDILQVEKELARVRGEAEVLAAAIAAMDQRVRMTTIALSLRAPPPPVVTDPGDIWTPLASFWGKAKVLGKNSLSLMVKALTFLGLSVVFVAPWLLAGIFVLALFPAGRRRIRSFAKLKL